MIICSCRNISTREFNNVEELFTRLLDDDAECGCCQEDLTIPDELGKELMLKDKFNYNIRGI
jgi:hypothetical protein